jgi:hypothetical protein
MLIGRGKIHNEPEPLQSAAIKIKNYAQWRYAVSVGDVAETGNSTDLQ